MCVCIYIYIYICAHKNVYLKVRGPNPRNMVRWKFSMPFESSKLRQGLGQIFQDRPFKHWPYNKSRTTVQSKRARERERGRAREQKSKRAIYRARESGRDHNRKTQVNDRDWCTAFFVRIAAQRALVIAAEAYPYCWTSILYYSICHYIMLYRIVLYNIT